MDDLSLNELIDRETNDELRSVLECYRAAELALEHAAQRLSAMGQSRWQLAVMQRARDLSWQAQRYIKIERAREHKLADFASDADTNPRGSLPGPSLPIEPRDPTPLGFEVHELPPEEPPPLRERFDRIAYWALHAVVVAAVFAAIWLVVHFEMNH